MAKQKPQIEELQRDEVADVLHNVIIWCEDHLKQVITGAIAVVGVLIVWILYQNQREGAQSEINSQFNQALTEYMRLDTISEPAAGAENERVAMQNLASLIDDHGNTPLGNEARLMRGNLYFNEDRFAEAQKDYQAYIDESKTDTARARGEIALAYAFENEAFLTTDTKKQSSSIESAHQHYMNAQQVAGEGSYLATYARLGEARYYELTNNKNKAIEIYQDIIKTRPAPVPPPASGEATAGDAANIEMLRKQLDATMKTLSFETAAQLRLDRLKANAATAKTTSATTVISTP